MSDKKITTINPATEKSIASYEYFSEQEAIDKVEACNNAFTSWKNVSLADRAKHLNNIASELRKQSSTLAPLMTQEMGKLLEQSESEIELCAAICEHTAKIGQEELQDEQRELSNGGKGVIQYAPIGVIYGIQPWNYPAYQVIRYAIVNIMAGNGVLLKHAESVTGTGLLLEKIFKDAGLPEFLFTTIIVDKKVSKKVIKHKAVRGVTFTGSPGAGATIGKQATKELKKTVLELGSNDAYLILKDADLKVAVEKSVKGRIYNNGETCIAAKRFIVVADHYDAFVDQFVKAMKDLKIGDPTSKDVDMGPMARKDLRDELHDQVKKSVENGAKILCGGQIPDQTGFFYPATVLVNVTPGQPAYDDELFGPVASVIKAKDDEDAMRIANDSRYGLGGGIFSKNEDAAIEMAKTQFDTGMVFINSFGLAQPTMPFGGVKNSGYGREHGGFGLKEFVNVKSIMILKDK